MTIRTQNLTKKYMLKTALEHATLTFQGGKIHALVGENGAGKSTLAKILAGDIYPTSGKIFLDNKEVSFKSAKDSLQSGIVLVHQRPLLASKLTAKENIILKFPKLMHAKKDELYTLKDIWASKLHLDSYVKDLGGDMRFYVSLIGSLLRTPSCLILDEPSAFLDVEQRKKLYTHIRKLADEGTTVIIITHSTEEAIYYTDTVTLMKEGTVVKQFATPQEYKAYLDVQHAQNITVPHTTSLAKKIPCLEIKNVSSRPKNRPALLHADITVHYGEITSIQGLQEAATSTLEDFVTGMECADSKGTVIFTTPEGTSTELNVAKGKYNTAFLRSHNTAIIPSDKTFRASHPDLTIEQILSVYNRKMSEQHIQELIQKANVHITPKEYARNLSGGMLQRLILERELSISPDLMILCNPMQGLDVQAQVSLCERLAKLAQQGKAILIIGAVDVPPYLSNSTYRLEGGITHHE